MSHPRPWRKAYSKTFSSNGSYHVYIADADGRKICAIWGKEDGERAETAELIIRAVRAYDRALELKSKRASEEELVT